VQSTSNAGFNFNWMEIVGGGTSTPPPPPSTDTTTSRIEAENYSSMSGIQTENTQDAGGGKDVGWIDNGDWMDYSVNVSSAGTYTLNLRLASPFTGGQLQIKNSAGSVLATVSVPYTGGFQTWQTVSANISLATGTQTIRVQSTSNAGFNFNWMEIVGGGTNTSAIKTQALSGTLVTTSLNVYPNPVTNKFQLQINNDRTGALSVQVYDAQGRLQKLFSLKKNDTGQVQYYLSIGELSAGTYIISAVMDGWSESKQIVRQ
jgi:endoglucanase